VTRAKAVGVVGSLKTSIESGRFAVGAAKEAFVLHFDGANVTIGLLSVSSQNGQA
jgi:hypothetical protein